MTRPSVRPRDERPASFLAVLVYDGECPCCSAAATALRRLPGVGAVPHADDAARRFLAGQFQDVPFALVLADVSEERVYVGRDAARELCARAGLPVLVPDLVGENYETIADAIRTVPGPEADPDPYHDVLPMADAARDAFDDLAEAAEGPAVVVTE